MPLRETKKTQRVALTRNIKITAIQQEFHRFFWNAEGFSFGSKWLMWKDGEIRIFELRVGAYG